MRNVFYTPSFSKSFLSAKTIGNKDKDTVTTNGDLLAQIKNSYTKSKVLQFLVESEEYYNKRELLYLLVVCSYYSDDFNFLAEEQKNFYPCNTNIRGGTRSAREKQASQPDVTRVELMRKGDIEYIKDVKGIKFSHKFYLQFCLYQLKKKRKELIESSYLRMITEQDFAERVKIEELILGVEKQIKDYKPTKEGQPQPRRKRTLKNKKPSKHGASRV